MRFIAALLLACVSLVQAQSLDQRMAPFIAGNLRGFNLNELPAMQCGTQD